MAPTVWPLPQRNRATRGVCRESKDRAAGQEKELTAPIPPTYSANRARAKSMKRATNASPAR
jgi:hypothetical protein